MTDHIYKNRMEAAQMLASKLSAFKDKDPLVLGIPRGGLETAYYVANALNARLSVIIAKKIPHPAHPEYGIGAIAEDGTAFFETDHRFDQRVISQIASEVKDEIQRRINGYRFGQPLPDMTGRTVILVDDGIATGVTMAASVKYCRKKGAGRIVVAAPVSGKDFSPAIRTADEIVILQQPQHFSGVGQFYEDFSQLSDEDVMRYLNDSQDGNGRATA
jgi:putative phosphoribosyl transferase